MRLMLQILAGSSSIEFGKKIAKILKTPLSPIEIKHFADGEIYVRIKEKVRGNNVFLIQSLCPPVNDSLMETLIIIDALRRASAEKINLVSPYLGYSRQDRKVLSREPITAKLVANLITKAGTNRLITTDLHVDQIQGYYDIPVDHFVGYPLFADYILKQKVKNIVVVAPDIGAVKRNRKMATLLHAPLAIIDKRRQKHNQCEIMNVVGDVSGKTAVILDDIIDTAGTITTAASVLKDKGAKKVIICATHALLSGNAVEKLKKSPASQVLLLDSIPIPKEKRIAKMAIISLAPLMAKVIKSVHTGKSLGKLFTWEEKEMAL